MTILLVSLAMPISAAMKDAGKTVEVKIYPPYGTSASDAHTFAYLGRTVWGDDVFRFLSRYCINN